MPSLLINQGTNSAVMFEDVGGTAYRQSVALDHGTVTLSNPDGTTMQIAQGTISLTNPTGTVNQIQSGSINVVAGTMNAGTLNAGTINNATVTSLPNLPGGTLGVVTTISNLSQGSINVTAGTIATLGTMGTLGLVNTVTTVSNITNGSIRVTAGTEVVTSGSISVIAGTQNVGTVNTGTINTGTINTGTINTGTFTLTPTPSAQILSAGTTTAATIGTLIAAAGAGNGIYINAAKVTVLSGTAEVALAYGLSNSGNQTIDRGNYSAGGGFAMSFPHPSYFGTANAAVTFNVLSGSGTVSYMVNYTTKGTP